MRLTLVPGFILYNTHTHNEGVRFPLAPLSPPFTCFLFSNFDSGAVRIAKSQHPLCLTRIALAALEEEEVHGIGKVHVTTHSVGLGQTGRSV